MALYAIGDLHLSFGTNKPMDIFGGKWAEHPKRLTDRRGYSFPLERLRLPEGCLVRVMNMLPLDLLDRTDHMPVWVSFEEESSEKVREVLNARDAGERVGDESTAGHWNRPVD